MGLLDNFGELLQGVSELRDELQGIKDDFISSVAAPGTELGDTVNDIKSSLTGNDK